MRKVKLDNELCKNIIHQQIFSLARYYVTDLCVLMCGQKQLRLSPARGSRRANISDSNISIQCALLSKSLYASLSKRLKISHINASPITKYLGLKNSQNNISSRLRPESRKMTGRKLLRSTCIGSTCLSLRYL